MKSCNYCGEAAVSSVRMTVELPPKDGVRQYKVGHGEIHYCSFHRCQAIDASCCNRGHYDAAWEDGLRCGYRQGWDRQGERHDALRKLQEGA